MSRVIGQNELSNFSEELAWKRSGFKDRRVLEQAVRDLPIEKKIEMLTEIKMFEMAEMLFEEKQDFLLNLGHKTWVDSAEIHKHAVETFRDDEWIINDAICFRSVCVFNGTHVSQMNSYVMDRLTEKREGCKNE